MKSVGEVMGLGRTFKESFLKAFASLEGATLDSERWSDLQLRERLAIPTPERMTAVLEALRRGLGTAEINEITHIDRWFLHELLGIVQAERALDGRFLADVVIPNLDVPSGERD